MEVHRESYSSRVRANTDPDHIPDPSQERVQTCTIMYAQLRNRNHQSFDVTLAVIVMLKVIVNVIALVM